VKTQGLALQPTVDGHTLPAHPFTPSASPLAANVPLMMGTTEHEVNFFPNAVVDPIDDAELFTRVKQSVRADDALIKDVIALYRHNRPKVSNVELYQIIASDNFRAGPMTQTERKAEQATSPVYQYYFRWQSVVRDGKLRAFHTLDIPFAFNNVEVATSMTGAAQSRYALATKVSSAFASFARTGSPNTGGLPSWPQFDMKTRATMAFNNDCEVINDPYREERLLLAKLREVAARNG
jgi:para-nitrobenzyl esterase